MENCHINYVFTIAGDPVIHAGRRSYIFEHKAADALFELNQVIQHLERLIEHCHGLTDGDIEGFYDVSLTDTLCKLQDLRDGEFGEYVNWNTIARAIRNSSE